MGTIEEDFRTNLDEFVFLKQDQGSSTNSVKKMVSVLPSQHVVTEAYAFDHFGNELFKKSLLLVISQLNEIVFNSGEEMWGNVCYPRQTANTDFIDTFPSQIEAFKSRRRNIARIAPHIGSIFEIGVNAGHSAALWLMFNKNITYYGLDIFTDNYMKSCANFLKETFRDRFTVFTGDSRTEIQKIDKKINQKVDLIHIDGGHSFELANSDLSASLGVSKTLQTKFILLDDTNDVRVRTAADKHIMKGVLQTETLGGSWEQVSNSLLRIV